jgi:hypothetical protein
VRITIRAKAAVTYHAGNCGENAAVASMWFYLNRQSVRPLDYCDLPYCDHGFFVIGSPKAPRVGNCAKWWEQGVVCDSSFNLTFIGRLTLQYKYGTAYIQSL